jgi:hypothetical protein
MSAVTPDVSLESLALLPVIIIALLAIHEL